MSAPIGRDPVGLGRLGRLGAWVRLLRPVHWLKNLLVLFPLFFNGEILDPQRDAMGLAGLVAFCLASSSIYALNDVFDRHADRLHPVKRLRPVAAGDVSVPVAVATAAVLAMAAIALTWHVGARPVGALLSMVAYWALNLGYSAGLKHVAVIDVLVLALGYVLRIVYGGQVLGIAITNWLFLTVMALSIYAAFGKRRGELRRVGTGLRGSLDTYTEEFLDQSMCVFMGCGLVFYSLWVFSRYETTGSGDSLVLVMSVLLAVFMCLEYGLDLEDERSSGDPVEVVTSDKLLVLAALAWVAVMFAFVYLRG